MHGVRVLLPALLVVSSVLAGCLSDQLSEVDDVIGEPGPLPNIFQLSGTQCEEAGFVAMYPMATPTKLAGVWEQADIREEMGNPTHDGLGTPSPLVTPQNGNHHIGITCKAATVNGETQEDYVFGYVGQMVLPPAWDPGGAAKHVLIGGNAFQNGSFADALRATTKADIGFAIAACTQWAIDPATLPGTLSTCQDGGVATAKDLPRSFAYSFYHDLEKGTYQSWSTMAKYRDLEERTVRFWWQVPADGSQADIWGMGHTHDGNAVEGTKWNPVYWDMVSTGGGQWTTPPGDGFETGEHNFGFPTGEHNPQFSQPMHQVYYEHETLTFTSGRVFTDVVLDDLWAH